MSNIPADEQPGGRAFEARRKKALDLVREFDRQARLRPNELRHELMPALQKLLGHAVNNSAWWRERLKDVTPYLREAANLHDLLDLVPLTTREDVQQYYLWMQAWVPGSTPSMYVPKQTSGSTGTPVRTVLFAPEIGPRQQAITLLSATWSKRDYSKPMVYVRASEQTRSLPAQGMPMNFLGKTGPAHYFRLTGATFGEILDFLEEKKAGNILINGAAGRLLALEQLKKPRKVKLDQILNLADAISDGDRLLAKKAFGAKIINRYSSEEFSTLAIECPSGEHMHATNFFNYIEILDENNRRTEPGQVGRVVVTSLFNPAMPLFRYELGDLASWGQPCQHGIALPVFEPVIARQRDAYIAPDGTYRIGSFARTRALSEGLVGTYQSIAAPDRLVLLYTRGPFARGDISSILLQDMIDIYGPALPVSVVEAENLDWLGRWKRRQLIRLEQPVGSDPTEAQLRDAIIATGYQADAGFGDGALANSGPVGSGAE